MIPVIPAIERPAVLRLFVYCMLAGSSYTLARTAGDSLFLSRVGNADLALLFVASGIVTAVVASLWFFLANHLALERFLRASTATLGALSILAWALLPSLHHSFYWLAAIYVLAEIKGCVNAINIVSAMNETLGGHSSRHSWATVLLGFPLACVVIGLLIGIESSVISVHVWLLLSGLLDLLAIVPTVRLSRHRVPKTPESQVVNAPETDWSPLSPYVCSRAFTKWIGVLIAAKVMVLTMVAFEWKVTVNDYYAAEEQALARYFGTYYAITGTVTLIVQFFVTGRLIANKGVLVPILVLPMIVLVLNTLFVLGSGVLFLLVVTTLAKSMDAWRRSTHDTALHLMYTKVEKRKRRGLIGRNHATIKPMAEVAASMVLLCGSQALHHGVLISATLIWLMAGLAFVGLLKKTTPEDDPRRSGIEQLASGLSHNH